MTVAILGLSTAALAQVEDNSHQSYKRFSWDYCTYYAAQVFDRFAATEGGIDWRGNGDEWLCAAQEQGWHLSTNPRDARIGAIIVWRNAGRGHVAVVDDVYADGILISEMNWHINSDGEATGGFNRISQSFLPFSTNLNRGVRRRYFFAGFIFPERTFQKEPSRKNLPERTFQKEWRRLPKTFPRRRHAEPAAGSKRLIRFPGRLPGRASFTGDAPDAFAAACTG